VEEALSRVEAIAANGQPAPRVTVIILNYNGAAWLERCLRSLRAQTIFDQIEVIVADNASPDKSDRLAADLMRDWPNACVVQHGENLGFCEGNNRAAAQARGKWLFFLNNDTWLEPDCIELLLNTIEANRADAGTPLMLNYDDDSVQSAGAAGFDIIGFMSFAKPSPRPKEIFVVGGCCLLILKDLFDRLGRFDSRFFMYAEEYDLSWRIWSSGGRAMLVPQSRVHHRGAAAVNPAGGTRLAEVRTSESKRFYTNRNCLMVLLKNCQHVLLTMVLFQIAVLCCEALVAFIVYHSPSLVKRAYLDAIIDCWRLRPHILAERQRIAAYRRVGDWKMLRFLRWRLNRWDELRNIFRHGFPQIANM